MEKRNRPMARPDGELDAHADTLREGMLAAWRAFLATRAGMLVEDHTPFVRRITERGENGTWALMAPGLVVLFALAVPPIIPIGAPWLNTLPLWIALAVAWTVLSVAFWLCYRDSEQRVRDLFDVRDGFMTRHQVREAFSDRAITAKAPFLLPKTGGSTIDGKPSNAYLMAPPMGYARHVPVYADLEHPGLILAPARMGKSRYLVAPLIACAPGPVVATSTRKDIIEATGLLRRGGWTDREGRSYKGGRVYVFDPMGVADSLEDGFERKLYERMRWSPVAGCEDPHVARIRAAALVGATGLEGENRVWAERGGLIVQALLHAAALDNRTIEDVYRWSGSWEKAQEAARILEDASRDPKLHERLGNVVLATDWKNEIEEIQREDPRNQSNKWFAVSQAFACLSEPKVRRALSVRADDPERFDMRRFLTGKDAPDGKDPKRSGYGTVYLLCEFHSADGRGPAGVGGFVSMFLSDLVTEARHIAQGRDYEGRLEPYATLVLDEIANIDPWNMLPQAVTAGSGDGICVWTVFQSRNQARDAYGEKEERNMWESCQKWVLGGVTDVETLRDLSELLGKRRIDRAERSWDDMEIRGRNTERTEYKPVLEPDEIRLLPDGMGLLVTGRERATAVNLMSMREREKPRDAKDGAKGQTGSVQAQGDGPAQTPIDGNPS